MESGSLSGTTDVHSPLETDGKLATSFVAADLDRGVVKFALNGQWNESSTAFNSLVFHDGLMPAASFSKGEKLCFNFGSAPSGFVYSPPSDEYLPVYIAQGNMDTMKKMEKMMQGKATAAGGGNAGFRKQSSIPNMPPPPPYVA